MSGNIKVNPEVASRVADTFTSKRGMLDEIITAIDTQVRDNIGNGKPGWEGKQATEFVTAWETEFKAALGRLAEALGGSADLLRRTITAYQSIDGQA